MDNINGLDLSPIPNELKAIIEMIKMDDTKYFLVKNKELLQDMDWKLFVELSLHHRLYPLLYSKIKLLDKGIIPNFIIQKLSQYYRKNTFQMLQLSAEMELVSKECNKNEIRLLFLKGPILAKELYGNLTLRTSSDLDILVPIKKLKKAEEIMQNLGYKKDDYIQTILGDWKWRHHHVTYFNSEKNIKIEIHWRLNPGPGAEPSFNELWQRRLKSTLTSYPMYTLGKEDLLLFLVSHGARHGWSRLRWLIDIDRLMCMEIDWDKAIKLLRKYQYFYVGGQALILASRILNTPVYDEMKPLLGKRQKGLAQDAIFYLIRMVNLHTSPLPDEISKFHKKHLFSLMSYRQKAFFILSFLYPYPEDAEILPLPYKLHILYFPLRPFIWAWRKTRKHALS